MTKAATQSKEQTSKKRAPEGESKRDRFKRVINGRLTQVIDGLRLIENMGPSQEYEFNSDDVDKIVSHINSKVEVMKNSLTTRKKATEQVSGLFDY